MTDFKNKNITIAVVSGLLLLLAIGGFYYKNSVKPESVKNPEKTTSVRTISLSGAKLKVQIADTEEVQIQGLSGRASLKPFDGMLFVFSTPDFYEIWMKDMKFPLDIIWFDQNGIVTYFKTGATPESYPQTFSSPEKSLYVLETEVGFVEKRNLKIGDKIIFEN